MLASSQTTVGTSASKLSVADDNTGGESVVVRNRHATASIYLGGSGVTTANGFEVLPGESVTLDLRGEDVYAIAGVAGVTVHVLSAGVA